MDPTARSGARARLDALRAAFFGSPFAPWSIPSLAHASCDPRSVIDAAGVHRLAELGPREVRELTVDDLCDPEALPGLLRSALEERCFLWVTTARGAAERSRLEAAHPGLVHELGVRPATAGDDERTWALGIHPADVARHLARTRPADLAVLHEIRTRHITLDLARTLTRAGVRVRHVPLWRRIVTDPRTWVYLVVFVYSALRALPVVLVPQFHGNVWVLWGIDVTTAVPYTWGVLAMVTATVPWVRAVGTVTAIATFLAPYAYFWMHGENYPPGVVAVVTAMILASVGLEVWRFRQERALRRRAADATPVPSSTR